MSFVKGIISITISAVVLTSVFIPIIKDTNTSTWTSSEVALWGLLTLAGVLGMAYGVFAVFGLV